MSRFIMSLLLVVAIGVPIWYIAQPTPWEGTTPHVDEYGYVTSSSTRPNFLPAKFSKSVPYDPSVPISVYAQPSLSNPALSMPSQPIVGPPINSIPNPALAGFSGPVVSNEALQAMEGQTVIFSGSASAPDLTSAPMEFVPTTNLEEIIRFDIFPNWVKSRWDRVSTSPGEVGLHGLRVALVTGTNTNDLHGSLTYYFDANQRVQRIAFQGWAGNSSKLIDLLTKKYGLKASPTQLAGFYLARNRRKEISSAVVMKHPHVIQAKNPAQQIAIALEINHPDGPFGLSPYFQTVVAEAKRQY